MPLCKELERRDGVIYVTEYETGDLLIAVPESAGLDNQEVMALQRRVESGAASTTAALGRKKLLLDAASALTRLANELGPDCPMCGEPATTDPSDHADDCIIQRLHIAAELGI